MASSLCAKCLLLGGLAGLLAGCPASGEDVRPPRDELVFPTALAVSPDESKLFVVSSNSSLLHDSGSVIVMDLDAVDSLVQPWLEDGQVPSGEGCAPDERRPDVLQCEPGRAIPDPAAGVRIGNFASGVGVQELASGDLRLFVTVRGDPSVTWIDYRGGELVCEGSEEVPLCDQPNRITHLRGDLELTTLVEEPFGLYVDSVGEYVLVSHQSAAAVSLIDAPADGSPPMLVDALLGLFAAEQGEAQAAIGVAGRVPNSGDTQVYVTSRSENRVSMLSVVQREGGFPALVRSDYFYLDELLAADDVRGIVFEDDGSRAYIANRTPPMLHVLDTALGADGFPNNRITATVEMCRDPSNVVVADTGRGSRVYVTCFSSGEVWVVNPDLAAVEAIIDVGGGPHALALAPERRRLYVGNFLENTIAVVDLTPGVETENRVVLRLGSARQAGDD